MSLEPAVFRPLPRRANAADSPYLTEYLEAAIEEIVVFAILPPSLDASVLASAAADRLLCREAAVRRLAGAAGISESSIRHALEGLGSFGSAMLWRLGEALRVLGVPWSSGLTALSMVPSYRGHALCIVNALMRMMIVENTNDHKNQGQRYRLWRALALILLQTDVQHRVKDQALADFPGATQGFSMPNWLSTRREWRFASREDLAVLGNERVAPAIAEIWRRHRERELRGGGDDMTLGCEVHLHGDMDRVNFQAIAQAIALERQGASLGVRAQAQDGIDEFIEQNDRLFSA
jgi:hypothetical protein